MMIRPTAEEGGRARPNLTSAFGDQHRGHAVGYAGDLNVRTPNLDRVAAEGTAFNGPKALHRRLPGHGTDCLADTLIDYLRRHAAGPTAALLRPSLRAAAARPVRRA
jgi:hypothetical protein